MMAFHGPENSVIGHHERVAVENVPSGPAILY
jgi:hypothetical protein